MAYRTTTASLQLPTSPLLTHVQKQAETSKPAQRLLLLLVHPMSLDKISGTTALLSQTLAARRATGLLVLFVQLRNPILNPSACNLLPKPLLLAAPQAAPSASLSTVLIYSICTTRSPTVLVPLVSPHGGIQPLHGRSMT